MKLCEKVPFEKRATNEPKKKTKNAKIWQALTFSMTFCSVIEKLSWQNYPSSSTKQLVIQKAF